MCEYHAFETMEDADRFSEMFNGLHDAYVTGFTCDRPILTDGCTTTVRLRADRVTIRVQVTSMREKPVVELMFYDVYDYNFPCSFSDMYGCSFFIAPDVEDIFWISDPLYKPGKFTEEEMRRWFYIRAVRAEWWQVDREELS